MTKLAFIGLGRMGAIMTGHPAAAEHAAAVWNRPPERSAPLVVADARTVDIAVVSDAR
ncbi:NAD(P)-binding domain-containing protein [Streptomyces sp. NPDC015220]|uniref:NAD(P)-binding domain-containing protein n=1 Tax=Streptomyces sp. NPDC015220 TaxID=3364947 RepID=UPI003700356F